MHLTRVQVLLKDYNKVRGEPGIGSFTGEDL